MKQEEINKTYILPSKGKVFLSNLLDSLFMLMLIALTFFGVINPIYNANFGNETNQKIESQKETVLSLGTESHLIYQNEKTGALSTPESLYKVMIFQQIKTCYEKYPEIYKKDLDDVGYETKTDFFKEVKFTTLENNDLSYFYKVFIIDKVDANGDKILSLNGKDVETFIKEDVYDINTEENEFFDKTLTNDNVPLLNKDTCRYLFQYHVMDLSYSTLRNVDYKFFNYFVTRYEEAGQMLLKIPEYKNAFEGYTTLYNVHMKNKVLFIILSFVISWLIYYFVISFFIGKKTLSQYLLKLDRLTFDKQKKSTILFEDGFLGFIKQFYTLFFITLIAGGVNLLSFSFIVIGIVTINITHLIMLCLILSIISLIVKFSSKTYQGIGERMFKIELYEETIS